MALPKQFSGGPDALNFAFLGYNQIKLNIQFKKLNFHSNTSISRLSAKARVIAGSGALSEHFKYFSNNQLF
jgi:hypothetical protein